ncbi:MAG: deoxyribonuclease IV [Bacilli bacterium]|jgi:deoxyribonuclease-4
MSDKLIIGSHVSMSGPSYYEGSVKEALSYGANAFMIYTGAPQNSLRKATSELKIEEGRKLIEENNIDPNNIVVHAPYIINLGNSVKQRTYDLAVSFLKDELVRVSDFKIKTLILHPGSHVGEGVEVGMKQIIEGLNEVFKEDKTDVKIALETMAGKGSEAGFTFEQIRYIIDNVKENHRLGVCLDTCHINDAGYDVHDVEGVLDEFDRVIGLDRLLVLHVNDSKNVRGARKDRHENIGYGTIGFETLNKYVNNPRLENIPKILETPYFEGKPPYKEEIAMFRAQKFTPDWRESL